jgi:hypothetical protein
MAVGIGEVARISAHEACCAGFKSRAPAATASASTASTSSFRRTL